MASRDHIDRVQRTLQSLERDPERVRRVLDAALAGGNADEISFAYSLWTAVKRR